MTYADLVAKWREEVALLEHRGLVREAAMVKSYADDLEQLAGERELEELTIREAAAESGYSESQLRRRFKSMKRIPRQALPKKGARRGVGGPDLAGEVLRTTHHSGRVDSP